MKEIEIIYHRKSDGKERLTIEIKEENKQPENEQEKRKDDNSLEKGSKELRKLLVEFIDKKIEANKGYWIGICDEISYEFNKNRPLWERLSAPQIGKLLRESDTLLREKGISHVFRRGSGGRRNHYFCRKKS